MLLLAIALAAAVPHHATVKPWDHEGDCRWWLSGEDGNRHLASIGQGDTGIVITVSDPLFMTWSESDRPEVQLRFDGDPKRTVTTQGWVSTGGGTVGMLGMELDADARAKFAEATSLEILRGGELLVKIPLAETPNAEELEACLPSPLDDWSAEEH
jgi:hypothetical protein